MVKEKIDIIREILNNKTTFKTSKSDYQLSPHLLALGLIKPKSLVFSAGCGAGREVKYLVQEKQCKVFAMDIDKKMLESSIKVEPNATYLLGDILKYKADKKFDYIVCLWNTINYFKPKQRIIFINKCYNNLSKNGKLIITSAYAELHWKYLLSKIRYPKLLYYYPMKKVFNSWFDNTKFVVEKIQVRTNILIVATKSN